MNYFKYKSPLPATRAAAFILFFTAAGRPYYEYRMQSESKDMLETFYSEVWLKNTYSTIHRINKIVEQNKPTGTGRLLVCEDSP
jgi:hypothetical protein